MVDSDATGNYNFKYVFDVYVGGATAAIRFKTPPNPYGKGIIDVNALAQGELNFTINLPMLSNVPFTNGEGLCGTVYILAGEEYSIGANGDILMYNGVNGATGQPAYGLYADGNFRPAPNATTPVVTLSWGQSAIQYYDYLAAGGETVLQYTMAKSTDIDAGGKWLTRYPGLSQEIRSDEDFTISWLNYNFEAATGPASVPYAMVVSLYNQDVYVGEEIYYNTVANGGNWTTCSTWPGGPTGAQRYISSFKINPADITTSTITRDKFDLWAPQTDPPYYQWQFGPYSPSGFGGVFGSTVDTNLVPPYTGAVSILTDDNTWLTALPYTGATGSTEIVYKAMVAATGSVLDLQLQSANTWGTTYPELQLWGTTSATLGAGANWEKVGVFTQTQSPATFIYYTFAGTTTKKYYALGLRFQIQNSGQWNQTYVGPYDYPSPAGFPVINAWNITTTQVSTFDKMCLTLYPYDTYGSCSIGATAESETMCLTINDTNCWGFDPIRFSWLNNLGGRDYYTFIKRNTNTQNANRATLYKLQGYWSAASYNVQDNSPARWGTQIFRADLTNTWTASTDWITDDTSAFLRGMFASPQVLVYLPGRSQPTMVTITDASYSVNTTVREKLFQYFVSFTESQPDVVQSF